MMDLHGSKYFKSLPIAVQESVMQSGMDFSSEEDLRLFVMNLTNLG